MLTERRLYNGGTYEIESVTLSRANLERLLKTLPEPDEHLYYHDGDGRSVVVVAEENATHYNRAEGHHGKGGWTAHEPPREH